MPVVEINEKNFESAVLRSSLPVLLEFGAEWCGPCKTVAPELTALAHELDGKAVIAKVDIDRSPTIAQALRVQSVPTFVVFQEGRPVGAKTGAMNRKQLRALLEPFLPRAAGAVRAEELVELLKQGAVSLVDTREPAVFARSRLPGATSLPLDELRGRLAELHMLPGHPVLYCRAGDKTKDLAAELEAQGIEVAFLEGGVLGWEGAGFALERPE